MQMQEPTISTEDNASSSVASWKSRKLPLTAEAITKRIISPRYIVVDNAVIVCRLCRGNRVPSHNVTTTSLAGLVPDTYHGSHMAAALVNPTAPLSNYVSDLLSNVNSGADKLRFTLSLFDGALTTTRFDPSVNQHGPGLSVFDVG